MAQVHLSIQPNPRLRHRTVPSCIYFFASRVRFSVPRVQAQDYFNPPLHRIATPANPPLRRVVTPATLSQLRAYTTLPDFQPHDRLSRPRVLSLARKTAVVVGSEHLPPMQHASPPSKSLMGHTISEAMRVLPEGLSSPKEFSPTLSRNGLPLEATQRMSARSPVRIGDDVHEMRMRSSLRALRSSSSSDLMRTDHMRRRGRSMMISGGAPLGPVVQENLRSLSLEMLRKSPSASSRLRPVKPILIAGHQY